MFSVCLFSISLLLTFHYQFVYTLGNDSPLAYIVVFRLLFTALWQRGDELFVDVMGFEQYKGRAKSDGVRIYYVNKPVQWEAALGV